MGFVNFWRNGSVSFAAVLIMIISLSVIGYLFLSRAVLDSTLAQIKDKVDINVYFTTSATEEEIFTLQKKIEALPEVLKVTYTSREQELEAFKERHQNDELTLQALDEIGENPLGAALNIKAKEPSQYEGVAGFLESQKSASDASIIDKINYNRNKIAIETLSKIMSTSKKVGMIVSLVFIFVAVLIVFNTIRLTIYMAREEISVMRLVGASTRYIKGPFVVEGIMYGFLGAVLTSLSLLPITFWTRPYTIDLRLDINLFTYYLSNMFYIGFVLVVAGVVIGGLSSYLAVKKYLKI